MNPFFFEFSGFAARDDLENETWKFLFAYLQKEQAEFLKYENRFRSKHYKWPRDPLHTWSRIWEYPYVYHHIQKIRKQNPNGLLRVMDFGSGVTFFPFSIARLGCDVICADIDPICAIDIPEAAKWMPCSPGCIKAVLIANGGVPIEANSLDVVYCISVLEHIPDFEATIDEMARVLKPNGILIITVDIDLRGNLQLGADQFRRLQDRLDKHFVKVVPERSVHPCNLLTTVNSPYHLKNKSPFFAMKQIAKEALRGRLIKGDPRVGVYLGIYSTTLSKRP
jgi:SAM-dependent methyltransferase